MSRVEDGYATPSLKELREVRSLLKIMTTIISKARLAKNRQLSGGYEEENEKRIFCTK